MIDAFAITIEDRQQLDLFRRRFFDLKSCAFLYDSTTIHFSMNSSPDKPTTFTATLKDNDLFRSFLLAIRQFIMKNEPVCFYKIYNVLYRIGNRPDLRECLIFSRKYWKNYFDSLGPDYWTVNDKKYTPGMLIDVLFNGELFHSDPDRVSELDEIPDFMKANVLLKLQFGLKKAFLMLQNLDLVAHVILNDPSRSIKANVIDSDLSQ